MTRPYSDDDLRAEAASQHYIATTDPDFMGIGEQMDDDIVVSTEGDGGGSTWSQLLPDHEDFATAQRAIDDLLGKAADVSEWAVNLGADGLEPDDRVVTAGENRVRVHFAFAADISEADRADIVSQFAAFVIAGLH